MRRLIGLLLALVAAAVVVVGAPDGAAAAAPVLDGVHLHHLPSRLGASTDFGYEYGRVAFAARVWESGSDEAGWRVDLDVVVMRGRRLSSPRALHAWFIPYEGRPAAEAHYRPVRVRGRRGWACHDEIFWLARPGVAIAVRLDRSRWSAHELWRTARGARLR
jgi:hypothetical protein